MNWSPPEPVWFSGWKVPLSRLPVGATYDQFNDSIVVVFANWNSGDTANSWGSCDANADPYGCSGELNVATIPGGTTPGVNFNGPWNLLDPNGNPTIATGPPAVACEYSDQWAECQVLFNGETLHRNVQSFEFCLWNGQLCGTNWNPGDPDTGGWTDTPIGLTFNGPTMQGDFVAVITEANAQGLLSFMEKPRVYNLWNPWQYPTWDNWFYWPPSHLGPSVNVHEGYQGYDVLFGN